MPSADDLLQRAKRSKTGWRLQELRRLYVGHGFEVREGGKHMVFFHPAHPDLIATVTRSRSLAIGYIDEAVKIIGKLKEAERGDDQ